jgi:ATP synthase protein I
MMARDKGLPRRLLLAQLAATLALALMLLPLGSKHALSGFAGGMIALVANGFFVTRVFAPYRAQQLERMVGSFYGAELGKLILTGLLFAGAFLWIRPLSAVALFGSFLVIQVLSPLVAHFLE